eukprot:ANDGO_00376.mRNA.1 Exportin-T
MDEFDAAVVAALDPTQPANIRSQAQQCLQDVSNRAHVLWADILQWLARSSRPEGHFFCVQTLDALITDGRLGSELMMPADRVPALFSAIMEAVRELFSQRVYAPYVVSKMAQLLCHCCVYEYPHRWPGFFQDLYVSSFGTQNPIGCEFYVHVMHNIHVEIADRSVDRSSEYHLRCTLIKDTMRDQVVPSFTEALFSLMNHAQQSHQELVRRSLSTLCEYAEWIDLENLLKPPYLQLLFLFLSNHVYVSDTLRLFLHMLEKGMEVNSKIVLVQRLNIALVVEHFSRTLVSLFSPAIQADHRVVALFEMLDGLASVMVSHASHASSANAAVLNPTNSSSLQINLQSVPDIKVFLQVAKIANTVVQELLSSSLEEDSTLLAISLLPWTVRFFLMPSIVTSAAAREIAVPVSFDVALDMCLAVNPAVVSYMGRSKRLVRSSSMGAGSAALELKRSNSDPSLSSSGTGPKSMGSVASFHVDMYAFLLRAIHLNLRIPNRLVTQSSGRRGLELWDADTEDMWSEFMEFRKNLTSVFRTISKVSPPQIMEQFFSFDWKSVDPSDVEQEALLWLFYSFGEGVTEKAAKDPSSCYFKLFWNTCSCQEQFLQLAKSPIVFLQYYEVVCRYGKFMLASSSSAASDGFRDESSLKSRAVSSVIRAMLGPCGIVHRDPAVRSRVSYLFLRLVKDLRQSLVVYLQEIIPQVAIHLQLRISTSQVSMQNSARQYADQSTLWLFAGYQSAPPAAQYPPDRPLRAVEQMHLFEAVGILVAQQPDGAGTLMMATELLTPVVHAIRSFVFSSGSPTDAGSLQVSASSIEPMADHISALGNLCKAFTSGRFPSFASLFRDLSSLVLSVYTAQVVGDARSARVVLREKVFLFFHRMIECMGTEFRWMAVELLVHTFAQSASSVDTAAILECIRMIMQCVMRFRSEAVSVLERVFPATLERIMSITSAMLELILAMPGCPPVNRLSRPDEVFFSLLKSLGPSASLPCSSSSSSSPSFSASTSASASSSSSMQTATSPSTTMDRSDSASGPLSSTESPRNQFADNRTTLASGSSSKAQSTESEALFHSEPVRQLLDIYRQFFNLLFAVTQHQCSSYLLSSSIPSDVANAFFLFLRDSLSCLSEPTLAKTSLAVAVHLLEEVKPERDALYQPFLQFFADSVVPTVLQIPLSFSFDLRDAECNRILKQIVALLRTLVLRFGTEQMISYVANVMSSVWRPDGPFEISEFSTALTSGDVKQAEEVFRRLIAKHHAVANAKDRSQ